MKHRFGLALAALIALGAITALVWNSSRRPPPPIITLPNGIRYQFAGVTYGKSPVPPALAAQVIHWLPTPLADLARKRLGASLSQNNPGQTFPTPTLFVWFRRVGTNPPSASGSMASVVLADQAGVVAGYDGLAGWPTGTPWLHAAFPLVPKRSRVLQCQFYDVMSDRELVGKVTFPNPLYRRFPQWQPEPIPVVKKAGDLEVRLDRVETGYSPPESIVIAGRVDSPVFRLGPVPRGFIPGVEDTAFDVALRSSEGTNTWVLRSSELSDATGNVLRDSGRFMTQERLTDWGAGYGMLLQGTLWPDEAAWRLRLEFQRPAGSASGDLITFRNVPLLKAGATGPIRRIKTQGPFQFVLEETPDTTGQGADSPKFHLEIRNAPSNLAADLVRVTAVTGAPVSTFERAETRPGSGTYSVERSSILWPAPTNVTAVDITWALEETRTVEFLVKPPKAK